MPKLKERSSDNKIKRTGKEWKPKGPLRQITAKFRRRLVERQRDNSSTATPDTQAAEQSVQAGMDAVEEVGYRAEKAVDRLLYPAHRPKVRKEQIKESGRHPKERTDMVPSANDTLRDGKTIHPNTPDSLHNGSQLTPETQMKQQTMEKLERSVRTDHPKNGQFREVPHYGGTPQNTYTTKKERSPGNQSINPSIKERPRRSSGPKEKPPGGAFTPKTRKAMDKSAQVSTNAVKTTARKTAGTPAAKQVMERARRKAQTAAQRSMLQKSKQTAKAAAELSRKAAVAVTKAVAALVSALVSLVGGVVLVAALAVMALIAALLASPFGIFFSNEPSRDAIPLNAGIAQINVELADELETLQTGDYDSIDIQGQPPAWKEVVAVFAVKTAGGDDGVDVAALTPDRIERLRAVFWDMCQITTETETVEGENSTETILHITITPKTADDMRTVYSFSEFQNKTLTELLEELDALDGLLGDLAITQADAVELLQNLPEDLSPERRAVVETACKLVGKVNYFWGGKSLVLGWDSRWGQLSKVWADGSSTTGTYRPYGLDCSGFVDWTFYNVSNGEYVIGHGGGARMQHTYCTSISWEEAQPGDLVFYPEDTHVGIVGGRDENGNLLIVHCASGANNVVITGLEGFTSIGRPLYYGE